MVAPAVSGVSHPPAIRRHVPGGHRQERSSAHRTSTIDAGNVECDRATAPRRRVRYATKARAASNRATPKEDFMKRRDFVKLCGSSVALAGVPGIASAQDKVVWKASDVHPLGYPTGKAIQRMGKKLETQTNGRISIQMYPLMQLGGEKEMIEQA